MIRWAAAMEKGSRERQEDAYSVVSERAFAVVSDGMGGHANGDLASLVACKVAVLEGARLGRAPAASAVVSMFEAILRAVQSAASGHDTKPGVSPGAGCTVVCAWVGPTWIVVAHVGDSPAFLWTPTDGLARLTRDHAMAPPYSNVLTRTIGSGDPRPDVLWMPRRQEHGAKLLLCSDGITHGLSDAQIAQELAADRDIKASVESLAVAAASVPRSDNSTAVCHPGFHTFSDAQRAVDRRGDP
jgi:protein phosphatase